MHDEHALRPEAPQRMRAIQRAFGAMHDSYDWRFDSWRAPWRRMQRLRYWAMPILLGLALGVAALAFYDLSARFGSADLAMRHLMAAPNCAAARDQGLERARRGQAGYYERHDRDQDGVACEPYIWR